MGGGGGPGTNPGQLFAVGYAACFTGAVKAVGRVQKIDLPSDMSLNSHVTFNKDGDGFALSVELVGTFPGLSKEGAEALMKAAHACVPLLQGHPREHRSEALGFPVTDCFY